MPLYLLHADKPHLRSESGLNAVLVDAADEATARTIAAVDEGHAAQWSATVVAETATLPVGRAVLWFEGVCASLLGMTRGGDPV